MSSNAFVLVQNAERIIARARLVGRALEVHFADGAHGILPADVVQGRHRLPPSELAIPTPYKVVLRFGRSTTETFPWDYLRGFCDPDYERRAGFSGMKAGDRVILEGLLKARPGTPVIAVPFGASPSPAADKSTKGNGNH